MVWKRIISEPDLVAAEAIYHHDCYVSFFLITATSGQKRGRPKQENISEAMDTIFDLIKNSEECQFSISDLIDQLNGYKPDVRIVKSRLIEKYGNNVIISENSNNQPILCLRSFGDKLLNENWYINRNTDAQEERYRIISAAAEIIREYLWSQVHECSYYESPIDLLKNVDNVVPESLRIFLESIILKKKK